MMSKQHIHIGIEDASRSFDRFVEARHNAETGEIEQAGIHLNFEDFPMLSAVLTPKRLEPYVFLVALCSLEILSQCWSFYSDPRLPYIKTYI